ncbi:MAG: alpha/beta hydrolase [Chitinophagales bacterium]
MHTKEISIQSKSNHTIVLTVREPAQDIKGIVQINTGTCIPQKVYWKFAEFLTKNGYVTITYDYTDAANYTSEVTHEVWLKDLESVFDYVLKKYPANKKYIIGHSSGGQLAGYMNNYDKIDNLYLVACANGYVGNLNFITKIGMQFFWKIVMPFSIKRYGYMNNKLFGSNGGFPKNIITELGSWCQQPDFFVPYFKAKGIPSYYDTVKCKVKAFHLADDVIANRKSCEYILNLYVNADKSIETLHAKDFGMKKFGHRGFFFPSAEKLLWPKFLKELEQ